MRERRPERKASREARFKRWYAMPEKRRLHVQATIAARRRRRVAERVLAVLAAGAAAVATLTQVDAPDLVAQTLAALWYTGRIVVEGEALAIAIPARSSGAGHLRLPPASVELPPALRPSSVALTLGLLRARAAKGETRGLTAAELAEQLQLSTDAIDAALVELKRHLSERRRVRSKRPSYVFRTARKATRPAPLAVAPPPAALPAPTVVDPWGLPSPEAGPHLPGAGLLMQIDPPPSPAIELGQARVLHGLITDLLDVPHSPRAPAWALVPWPASPGWGLYLRDEAHVAALALGEHEGRLFDRAVRIRFGAPIRLRYPAQSSLARQLPPGRYQLRLDAITPVCIRHSARTKVTHLVPTAENLLSTLTQAFPSWIGLASLDPASAALRLVARRTQPERVYCGSHLGGIRGWTGSLVLEVNAVAAFLLGCAAQVGLGGRTAFGFGRVRVSEATPADVEELGRDPLPAPTTWTFTTSAVEAYMGARGVAAGQARRAMTVELRLARRAPGGAAGGTEVWLGPAPANASYTVRGAEVMNVRLA